MTRTVCVLLDSVLFWPFSAEKQWSRIIGLHFLLLLHLHAHPPSFTLTSCSPSLQGRPLERVCVCACVIPHMVGYIILSACVCSCGCLVCTYVCAWGCSLMLHIDFNIRDMHAAVTYLTILLPGQPANYHYCHYFTFIVSFYLFSWCV